MQRPSARGGGCAPPAAIPLRLTRMGELPDYNLLSASRLQRFNPSTPSLQNLKVHFSCDVKASALLSNQATETKPTRCSDHTLGFAVMELGLSANQSCYHEEVFSTGSVSPRSVRADATTGEGRRFWHFHGTHILRATSSILWWLLSPLLLLRQSVPVSTISTPLAPLAPRG